VIFNSVLLERLKVSPADIYPMRILKYSSHLPFDWTIVWQAATVSEGGGGAYLVTFGIFDGVPDMHMLIT